MRVLKNRAVSPQRAGTTFTLPGPSFSRCFVFQCCDLVPYFPAPFFQSLFFIRSCKFSAPQQFLSVSSN